MPFAQLVIGSPGAGKSTYCNGMHQFTSAIGRKCSVVNLDPANDHTSYPVALDVRDLVTLEEIMEAEELGPNGGVLYALEELEHNLDWLESGLKELGDDYILFDCPGQVELFTHHSSLRHIFLRLEKLGYREGEEDVDLDNLDEEDPQRPKSKFSALNVAICEMVENFGLLSFHTLAVEDKQSMLTLLRAIDRAGGYAFGSNEGVNETVWQVAMREGETMLEPRDVQERWLDRRDEFDEKEREAWKKEAEAEAGGAPPGPTSVRTAEDGDNGIKVLRKD
ncbi:putative atp binding [Diplodia seriata]|uniref:GPN-loop GTPase 2 n=1 Tax=Diplodia seriata TaxID=420778 RepID=A0A0G2EIX4_9PEZI|nr:putative atp binding [Diplodia seriata]